MKQVQIKHPGLLSTRILWLALAALVTLALLSSVSDLRKVTSILAESDAGFTFLAVCLVGLYAVNMAEMYRSIFRAGGLTATIARFLLISSASNFINLVSKTSGFGGLSLYLGEGRRRGESAMRVSAAYFAAYVLGYAAYLCVLVASLVMLYVRGDLTTVELGASGIIFAIVAVITSLVVMALRSAASVERILLMLIGVANRALRLIGKEGLASPEAVHDCAAELHDSLRAVVARPFAYVRPFVHALGVELISALILYTVARSLHVDLSFQVALAGYAITLLFAILSVTPAGLGFVEVSLTVFLASFGVSKPDAIAITLAYRFFEFWLPVAIGAVSLLFLKVQHATPNSQYRPA